MSTLTEQLTVAQVAEILQTSEITIRRMIQRGELPAYRFGKSRIIRIDNADLLKLRRPVTPLAEVVAANA